MSRLVLSCLVAFKKTSSIISTLKRHHYLVLYNSIQGLTKVYQMGREGCWKRVKKIKNKAFVRLGSCDNIQTERSIFEYANWPRLQVKRTGPSSWSVQLVRPPGLSSWSIQLVHLAGLSSWGHCQNSKVIDPEEMPILVWGQHKGST